MKALITGASSGLGKDMATYLSSLGYETILVARSEDKLKEISKNIKNSKYIICDLTKITEVKKLYQKVKDEDIDILINNAGFGKFGEFTNADLDDEIDMINVNIIAVHALTKLFLKDFKKRNNGYIMNVSSSAAFMIGPLMSTYYATKAYVFKLTMSIYEELRKNNSNVHISVLCPGPVSTNFNNVANVKFEIKSVTSKYVSKYAIDQMFKNKLIIIPSLRIKLGTFFARFISYKLQAKIGYIIQKKKDK